MKYKKILLLSICLLLGSLVLTTVPMVSALDIQTGYEPYATLKAGVRYKDFGNGGDRAVYLGVPDLGVSTNRVESEYTWGSSHYVIFDYKMRDPSTNIYTGIDANDPLLSYDVGTLTSIDAPRGVYFFTQLRNPELKLIPQSPHRCRCGRTPPASTSLRLWQGEPQTDRVWWRGQYSCTGTRHPIIMK